jgi:HEAT repeat protein
VSPLRLTGTLVVALAGCPKAGTTGPVDPTLPEQAEEVEPKEPLPQLKAGADSLDPSPRARALALLVEHVGPDPWGRRALLDPTSWVRRAGIEALAARGDPESRAMLEAVAADAQADPYLRGLAAMRVRGPVATRAIVSALAEEREPWRVAPLALAAVQLGDGTALPVLQAALEAGELPLDLAFLEEVGRSGSGEVAAALALAQDRVEDELVLPVAAARMMLGDAAGEQALRKALSDPDEERRMEALDYVVLVDHPAAVTLLRRASSLGPERVRWYADLALAARTGGGAETFERAFASADRDVRMLSVRFAAASAEQHPSRRSPWPVVVDALRDPDATIRATAARGVAALHLDEARAATEALLSDEVQIVRIEAAAALLALGG